MDKRPFVTKEKVEKITKIYPTPFHLYDEKGIRENVKALKEAFFMEQGLQRILCGKSYAKPVFDRYFERVWLRLRLLFLYRTYDVGSS